MGLGFSPARAALSFPSFNLSIFPPSHWMDEGRTDRRSGSDTVRSLPELDRCLGTVRVGRRTIGTRSPASRLQRASACLDRGSPEIGHLTQPNDSRSVSDLPRACSPVGRRHRRAPASDEHHADVFARPRLRRASVTSVRCSSTSCTLIALPSDRRTQTSPRRLGRRSSTKTTESPW